MVSKQQNPEAVVKEIRRQTRRKFSTEERIRIVLEGLRGEVSIAELCRRGVEDFASTPVTIGCLPTAHP